MMQALKILVLMCLITGLAILISVVTDHEFILEISAFLFAASAFTALILMVGDMIWGW